MASLRTARADIQEGDVWGAPKSQLKRAEEEGCGGLRRAEEEGCGGLRRRAADG